MTNKSYIFSLVLIIAMVFTLLSGCKSDATNSAASTTNDTSSMVETNITSTQNTPSSTNEPSSTAASSTTSETTALNAAGISNEDFDVNYKGITLNDKTSLEELSDKLNISINEDMEDNDTIDTRAAGANNDMDYYWYQISYPNKEHAEIIFDYLYNATLKSGRIVSIDLKNVPTKRGITVGDTLEKIKHAYGNDIVSNQDTDTTYYIELVINNNTLTFTYDKSTEKILSIYIDFDSNKAMEEMDITGFGD